MSVESLKEKARAHEQREAWGAALDLYLQAVRKLDEADQTDIGLYNRVGDLEIRLGKVEQAADHYLSSVDLYVEAELPNNAIAVCKKIIRNVPSRTDVYLRMGQIRASQGFLTDARQSFLTYAEAKQHEGDLEEAFRALIEFADLAPDDTEIRLALAQQLHAHDRTHEAVEQLLQARSCLILASRGEEAAEVEAKVLEMSPDTVIPDAGEIRAQAPGIADGSDEGETSEEMTLEGVEAAFVGSLGEEEEGAPEPPPDEHRDEIPTELPSDEYDPAAVHEIEVGDLHDWAETPDSEVLASPTAAVEVSPPAGVEVSPPADVEEEAAAGLDEPWGETADADLEALEELADSFDGLDDQELQLESVNAVEGDDEEDAAQDPSDLFGHAVLDDWAGLDEDDPEASEASPEAPRWADAVADAPDEPEPPEPSGDRMTDPAWAPAATAVDVPSELVSEPMSLYEQGLAAMDGGRADDAVPLLEAAYAGLALEGDFENALAALKPLTEQAPDKLEYRQRIVEYAFHVNDPAVLTEAYLELASCLERSGDAARAQAVYQQVLSVDPGHEAARAALGQAPDVDPAPAVEVASSEDYVDLGALVFDEEEEEKTTRWFVEMEDPTGDDEADFARMLSQFKEKVAEHLEADDVRAHYDLGTAYREMGLVDEAIAEFQQALRAAGDHLPTYEMLGQCFMEKGQYEVAIRSMSKALVATYEVEDELLGIYYYLGRANEELGKAESATDFYEKIFTLDINFRDVTERLRALR